MKKRLTFASAVALSGFAAEADFTNGFYSTVSAGYSASSTSSRSVTSTTGGATYTYAPRTTTGHGLLMGIGLGYMSTLSNKLILGLEVGGNYDTGRSRRGEVFRNGVSLGRGDYRPRFSLDFTLRAGKMINDKLSAYVGLGNQFGFARFNSPNQGRQNTRVFSLIPMIGVRGHLSEMTSWMGEIGYRFATNIHNLNSVIKESLRRNPRGFQARVGVSYHF